MQHQLQGAALCAVGAVEVARLRDRLRGRVFASLLPLAVVGIGVVFVLHSQHGGGDMALQLVQHRVLGATVILAGLVKGADRLGVARGNWASVGWLLLLLAATVQLFLYVEPGAAPSHVGH